MSTREMVINYVPGEECRVAVIEGGRLEEFHAERMDSVGHVGNIYVGKVQNVEPAIQAAFVDFGLEHNGFLHVSDLHPMYFPGEDEETTERVGKKTPRRERPPMQKCLRKGQEVLVQVLKEGVGTKGPTLTSYLSIPGRFLVMMPQMDRVGVSRKVEDEDTRRKMREILDTLDLPEGFGFILRTAGLERNKTEIKRDLAYLQRLWKDMERRRKKGRGPRLLYSEKDLLVRSLRDMLASDIDRVVVDDERAVARAARFLKIVAPRSSTRLVRYSGPAPIFHALGVEEQIKLIHAREVPLPSGGRLVIDETEAVVAIDVNSGRMRDSKDAETTALRTNREAADEICRQLRLRDAGGVVINDLIDMRPAKNRREIEARFKEQLKRDRARSSVSPISQFGILEMTRQRMRGSHESVHFSQCPMCRGRGLVQRPESVSADALRDLQAILVHERVVRVEMVVSARLAGELLSTKRKALLRIERRSGKHVDVRVSDAIPVDRVSFYAYDDRGSDIDLGKLGDVSAKKSEFESYDADVSPGDEWAAEPAEGAEVVEEVEEPEIVEDLGEELDELDPGTNTDADADADTDDEDESEGSRKRRRRRGGRGRKRRGDAQSDQPADEKQQERAQDASSEDDSDSETGKKKKRRRRGGRGRRRSGDAQEQPAQDEQPTADTPANTTAYMSADTSAETSDHSSADADRAGPEDKGEEPGKKKRSRRGGRGRGRKKADEPSAETEAASGSNESGPEPTDDQPAPKKKTKRKRSSKRASDAQDAPDAEVSAAEPGVKSAKKKRGRRAPSKKSGTADADAGSPNGVPPKGRAGSGDDKKPPAEPKPKVRSLYGAGRRRLSASERRTLTGDE